MEGHPGGSPGPGGCAHLLSGNSRGHLDSRPPAGLWDGGQPPNQGTLCLGSREETPNVGRALLVTKHFESLPHSIRGDPSRITPYGLQLTKAPPRGEEGHGLCT